MPEENLLDSIRVISDGINAMNDRLASMLPVAGYNELEKKRDEAVDRLHFLVRLFISTSTHRYIKADSELVIVNKEMKGILAKLEKMQKVIDSAAKFVLAIDKFIGAISQII